MCPYSGQILRDWINLPCVIMVSRHLSVKHRLLLWARGRQPSQGPRASTSLQPLQSLAQFTPLRFNSPWPNVEENEQCPFHWGTWNNFIWRGWKDSRYKERERGHLRNESCGLCRPRASPDPFFHYFPKERLFSAARFCYYTDIMADTQHCLATAVDSFSPRRSSLGEIPYPRFAWSDVNPGCQGSTHVPLLMWPLSSGVRRACWDVLSSSPFPVHKSLRHFLTSVLPHCATHFILSL